MGLKITKIQIENFRKFREPFVLNLTGPSGGALDYVVLAGPNGCGKTTVLEAILFALAKEDLITCDLPINERPTSPRIALPAEASFSLSLLDDRRSPPLQARATRRAGQHYIDFPQEPSLVHRPFVWAEWPIQVEYISSRRMPALVGAIEVQTNGRRPAETEGNRLWLLKHRILQQQSRRGGESYSGPEPLDRIWVARLNAFWATFRPDGSRFALAVVDPANLEETKWDLFLFQGDKRICSIDSLSAGEMEVLAMASPFIVKTFDGLLLFDEPELHMHPEWQGRIIPALRTLCPHAQIIVATHADDPWDDAFTFQRFLMVPDDDPRSEVWRRQHLDAGAE